MGRPRNQRTRGSARRTRPGSRGSTGGSGSRGVTITEVSPVGNISGSSPMVRATVKDSQATISKSDISVSLDGGTVQNFQYRRTTGSLTFSTGKLPSGAHTVEVAANAAGSKGARKSWSFVVK